jgi:hypothetical protein
MDQIWSPIPANRYVTRSFGFKSNGANALRGDLILDANSSSNGWRPFFFHRTYRPAVGPRRDGALNGEPHPRVRATLFPREQRLNVADSNGISQEGNSTVIGARRRLPAAHGEIVTQGCHSEKLDAVPPSVLPMSASIASASSSRTHGSPHRRRGGAGHEYGWRRSPFPRLPRDSSPNSPSPRSSWWTWVLAVDEDDTTLLVLCGGRELAMDSRVLQRRIAIAEFGATRARSAGKKRPVTRAQHVSDSSKRDGRAAIGWQVGSKAMARAISVGGGGGPDNPGPIGGDTSWERNAPRSGLEGPTCWLARGVIAGWAADARVEWGEIGRKWRLRPRYCCIVFFFFLFQFPF